MKEKTSTDTLENSEENWERVKECENYRMCSDSAGEESGIPSVAVKCADSRRNTSGGGGGKEKQDKEKNNNGETPTISLIKDIGVLNQADEFKSDFQYINIIGCIEGHMVMPADNKTTKYEHIIPELIAVEENPKIKGLLLTLNTVGGDVEAGLAIAEVIAAMSKPAVSLVLGGGHSIGIPLAVAADYTFIAKTATMTLHPIRTSGQIITAEPTFHYLRKTQDRIIEFIVEHSSAKKEKILELVNKTDNIANDVGTVLFGHEAVNIGLIDEVGGLREALHKLKELCGGYENRSQR